ncbi:MAG: M10 family metallopeptidase C-terminal domain-containing protein [Pseudomonadota bacterium]
MGRTRATQPSADLLINAYLGERAWAENPSVAFVQKAGIPKGYDGVAGLSPLPRALEKTMVSAMAEVEGFTKLSFAARPHTQALKADIRVFHAEEMDPPGAPAVRLGAYAFLPSESAVGGDVWFGPDTASSLRKGEAGYRAVLHELGHALGLKHPDVPGPYATLPAHLDGVEHSVMSARDHPGAPEGIGLGTEPRGHAQTFMTRDIAALQHLYGANYADKGDDTYRFDPKARVLLHTIWDGGGHDTYDFGSYIAPLVIDLSPGGFTTTGQEPRLNWTAELGGGRPVFAEGSIHNAHLHKGSWRSGIEDAIGGTGDDAITGNRLANRLDGGRGEDTINGADGRDHLLGGAGNDSLFGGAGDDRLFGDAGADTLMSGTGNDRLDGGTGSDRLDAEAGSDKLFGREGDDALFGGAGNDLLMGGTGTDALQGGDGDDTLLGGAGHDRLTGGTGDDVLKAGNGRDRLAGEDGADRLFGEGGDDKIEGGAGTDWLSAGDGDDRLYGGAGGDTLLGQGGDDHLFGGTGADTLVGGTGHDTLDGGAGADVLTGAAGSDLFVAHPKGGDTITDFTPGIDRLDVADPLAAFQGAYEDGEHTLVPVGPDGETIRLQFVALAQLDALDFV